MVHVSNPEYGAALQRLTVSGRIRIRPRQGRSEAQLKEEYRRWGARGIMRMQIGVEGEDGVFWLASSSRTGGHMDVKLDKNGISVELVDAQFAVFLSPQTRSSLARKRVPIRCDGLEGVHGIVAEQDLKLTGRLAEEDVQISEKWAINESSDDRSGSLLSRLFGRSA